MFHDIKIDRTSKKFFVLSPESSTLYLGNNVKVDSVQTKKKGG
jgi:hypothetical protein